MSKHTPGPWKVEPAHRGYVIVSQDHQYDIAVVRNIGNQDNKANAQLIAEAPFLDFLGPLESALERLVDFCNNSALCSTSDEVIHAEAVLERLYQYRALNKTPTGE